MRSGGSPTTLGVLLYAIGAATAQQPTGLFSDASACGKLSKTCDALASARAIYVHDDGRAHAMGVLPDGTVWTTHGSYDGTSELALDWSHIDGTESRKATWDGAVLRWEGGGEWRWREAGFAAVKVEGDQPFDGVYATEAWDGGLAGLRIVSRRSGRIKGVSVTVVGTDDGVKFFELVGAFRGWPKSSESFFMDFTPIGGVAGWDGIHTFDGSGSLIFPDGERWYKLRDKKEGEL